MKETTGKRVLGFTDELNVVGGSLVDTKRTANIVVHR